jgi:hypothetical protein
MQAMCQLRVRDDRFESERCARCASAREAPAEQQFLESKHTNAEPLESGSASRVLFFEL